MTNHISEVDVTQPSEKRGKRHFYLLFLEEYQQK
jgi:hypothetical protein